jgi:hypothetical protein
MAAALAIRVSRFMGQKDSGAVLTSTKTTSPEPANIATSSDEISLNANKNTFKKLIIRAAFFIIKPVFYYSYNR